MEMQTIAKRYIEHSKLYDMLVDLFGYANFEVETSGENYVLQVPRQLTDDEQKSLMWQKP